MVHCFSAIADERRKLYGVQFHPEVDLSVAGKEIFHNFLHEIADITGDFTMDSREQQCIDEIRSVVGDKKVLVSFVLKVEVGVSKLASLLFVCLRLLCLGNGVWWSGLLSMRCSAS